MSDARGSGMRIVRTSQVFLGGVSEEGRRLLKAALSVQVALYAGISVSMASETSRGSTLEALVSNRNIPLAWASSCVA